MGVDEPWFCYMVRCRDDSLYVGVATDVEERMERHNRGFGAVFTAKRRPVTLLWKKRYPDQRAARMREWEIKGWRLEAGEEIGFDSVGFKPFARFAELRVNADAFRGVGSTVDRRSPKPDVGVRIPPPLPE
jgi:putative endonuclease